MVDDCGHVSGERLLTAVEAADMLRVKPSWIYEQVRLGHLPHLRLGRYIRFTAAELDEWLVTQRVAARR
jgi:excisionase family DNA binding protein